MDTSPLIKICGLTRPGDAELAVELGADLVGLNFYPPSPRFLSVERAAAVARAVAGRARVVGVFVDHPPLLVGEIAERAGLDLVQFHGDEPPEVIAPWGDRAIKVFRLAADADAPPAPEILVPYPAAWGFLFDVRHPTLHGGTGRSWRWRSLAGFARHRPDGPGAGRPLLVAGGVRPDNARRALAESGAAGLDVCSGVESAPGIKDPVLLRRLFAEVRDDGEGTTTP